MTDPSVDLGLRDGHFLWHVASPKGGGLDLALNCKNSYCVKTH